MSHKLTARVGLGSVCSPLEVGANLAPQAARDLAALLVGQGCEVVEVGPIDSPARAAAAGRRLAESHVHAAAFVATSWFEDYLVTDLLEECAVPVLLWALPGMETGALCGCQQLTSVLKPLGAPYRALYGPLTVGLPADRAQEFLRAAALKARLRRARIGLAGHRVSGMTETTVDEVAMKKAIGPRIAPIDLEQLAAAAEAAADDEARAVWRSVVARSAACKVDEPSGVHAAKVYLAVKQLVARLELDALTVGCYPHWMGHPCLAASLLADDGIPLACEGDANGAVAQLMLTLLTGQPTHNTDWLDPLPDGSVVFSHCGSGSMSLAARAEEVTLASVRLMGQGACVTFTARPGPVTLLNLMPCGEGYQAAVLEGEALPTEMVFPGNPLRVRFRRPLAEVMEWIFTEGIGHHWMAGYGHVAGALRAWATLCAPGVRYLDSC